jgi:ATP-binding cassette subfamily C protein CydD
MVAADSGVRPAAVTRPWPAARALVADTPGAPARLALALAWAVAASLATVAVAIALAHAAALAAFQGATFDALRPWALVGAGACLARAAAEYGGRLAQAGLARRVRSSLRARLADRLVALGPAAVRDVDAGAAAAALLDGVDAAARLVSAYLPQLATAVATPLIVLVAVGSLDRVAAALLLCTAPLVPLFMVLIGHLAAAPSRALWDRRDRLARRFLDLVQGSATLRLVHRAHAQLAWLERASEGYRRSALATARTALLSALVLELVAGVATALVAVAVALALVAGRLGFAPALAVLILTPEFYLPQRALGAAFHQALDALAALASIERLLALTPPATAARARCPVPRSRAIGVRALNLSYAPAGRAPVFTELSFSLPPGGRLAVLGPSGAGKTTLVHMLCGYVQPTRGRIEVNGRDLATLDAASWRGRVGLVSQLPYAPFASVRDVLRAARPDADDDALWRALELADAAAFVSRLPGGLDACVGDRGLALSGGEAQRLALARLMLRNASLVLLDEPTEHLDPVARARVWAALDAYLDGRSLVLVTHRPDEAARADQTLLLARDGGADAAGRALDRGRVATSPHGVGR